MKFGPVATADAEGAILAHSVSAGARRLSKGQHVSRDDIAAALAAGIIDLVVATFEPGDVGESRAATIIGAALSGHGLHAEAPVHGRVNLTAKAGGLLVVDTDVDQLNAVDEALTLGTLPPFARVSTGDIVATVKVITFAAAAASVARCEAVAAARPLRLAAFEARRVLFVQTTHPGTPDKLLAKTAGVTRARCAALGLAGWEERRAAHDEEALAAALAIPADIILIAGASATSDRRDVIPAAIMQAGGDIVRLGMPVEPGNLLCLGRIGGVPVIGLPGCARSPKRNGFDWVLERLFAGLDVTSRDIGMMGIGGLLADVPRPEPRALQTKPHSKTGAIVLAAGRSVRMGANKLLADLDGRPVLSHVLQSVREAGVAGTMVVTGHEATAIAAIAKASGAGTIHADNYADGLSQSLAAGIRAVPADWSAVVVVLGDMPEVKPAHVRAVIAAAREHSIVVPVFDDKRGNPVAWGRRYFARLGAIVGDVGGKALLAEFEDAIIEVPVDSDGILVDVDTKEALEAVRRLHSS